MYAYTWGQAINTVIDTSASVMINDVQPTNGRFKMCSARKHSRMRVAPAPDKEATAKMVVTNDVNTEGV